MAICTSAALVALLGTDGYDRLSERDVLMCLANAYGTLAGLNATTALALSQSKGYDKLSDKDLDEALLWVLGGTTAQGDDHDRLSNRDLNEAWLTTLCT